MREPEFLPDWYHLRLRRARRVHAALRAAVALSLLAAAGVALSPKQAPAVVALSHHVSPRPAAAAPTASNATRAEAPPAAPLGLPAGAEPTLRALHRLTAGGIVVSSVTFRGERGATTVEMHCTADDAAAAGRFVAGLRRSHAFRDIFISEPSEAAVPAARSDASAVVRRRQPVTFDVSLKVTPAEAP